MDKLDEFLENTKSFNYCQRNWNFDKSLDKDILEKLLHIGHATPTKQSLMNFDLICVVDRNIIDKLVNASVDLEAQGNFPYWVKERFDKGQIQNPQVSAHALFLYFYKHESLNNKIAGKRQFVKSKNKSWSAITNIEIGISSSAIGLAANSIGLKTGFCRCIDHEKLNEDLFAAQDLQTDDLALILGVGHPLHKEHYLHNEKEFFNKSYEKMHYSIRII